tara:strand:+ start:269 stop:400 length:132 start_codon:yes stop_codon:yes gene_type:complete
MLIFLSSVAAVVVDVLMVVAVALVDLDHQLLLRVGLEHLLSLL